MVGIGRLPGSKENYERKNEEMSSKLSSEYLARASALRPKRIIAIWVLLLVVAVFAFGAFFEDGVTTEFTFINDPDSKKGETLLEERLTGPDSIREVVVVRSTDLTVDSPELQERVETLRGEIVSLGPEVVSSTETYFDAQDESLVSNDRRSTIIPVIMAGDLKDAEST